MSARTVYTLLKDLGYSLQSHRKTREGRNHPDRDAQFQHIATCVEQQHKAGQPVISVDAKKRELIGEFYNAGLECRLKQNPRQVKAQFNLFLRESLCIIHDGYHHRLSHFS